MSVDKFGAMYSIKPPAGIDKAALIGVQMDYKRFDTLGVDNLGVDILSLTRANFVSG